MIRVALFSQPTNQEVATYFGLYGGSCLVDYMQTDKYLEGLIKWFFESSRDGQDVEYDEKSQEKIFELYQGLKTQKWRGSLIVFTDDKKIILPDFTMKGYDIGADGMYYSPLGDGFLLEYNRHEKFYSEMPFAMYSGFRKNINDNWLFNSFDVASKFSQYCNFINQKHLHCIESEDNWRPFAIYSLNK